MSNPNTPPGKAGGLQTKHIILILGIILIVAAAVVAVIVLSKPEEVQEVQSTPIPMAQGRVMNEANAAQIQEDLREKVEKGMFETYMNTTWRFPDGESPSSNAVMGNSSANNYPFWFDIVLKDTEEVVFESGLLPVGTEIEEIVLSKDLEPGRYDARTAIHMVDENNEPLSTNASFSITLVIEG